MCRRPMLLLLAAWTTAGRALRVDGANRRAVLKGAAALASSALPALGNGSPALAYAGEGTMSREEVSDAEAALRMDLALAPTRIRR